MKTLKMTRSFSLKIMKNRCLKSINNQKSIFSSPLPRLSSLLRLYSIDTTNIESNNNNNSNNNKSGTGFGIKPKVNLSGLKKESDRQYLRAMKKVSKANDRLNKATIKYEEFLSNPNPSDKDFENCPNPDTIKEEIIKLKERVKKLNILVEMLKDIKSDKSEKYINAIELALELDVGDEAPPQQLKGKKKIKGTPPPPRKPYYIYTSKDNIEIRVGRAAIDNDELSCNPQHRDSADWWLHVSGAAGSHVVIRSHDDNLPELYPETVKDAALLATINSKGPQSGKATVSLVRARQVSKPAGAKPGLVFLNGDIRQIKINVKSEVERLDRLTATKSTTSNNEIESES